MTPGRAAERERIVGTSVGRPPRSHDSLRSSITSHPIVYDPRSAAAWQRDLPVTHCTSAACRLAQAEPIQEKGRGTFPEDFDREPRLVLTPVESWLVLVKNRKY